MAIETRTNPTLELRIAGVSGELSDSIRVVLDALPGSPCRPLDLKRLLGIKKDVASRVVRASREQDPLSSALLMPGSAPLRDLLAAARACGVEERVIVNADRALAGFERFIRDEIGDRATFESVVSSLLPEAREKHELLSKQSVYRGMCQVKGCSADVMINAAFIWPQESGVWLDGVWLLGWLGLRRIRPGAMVHFSTGRIAQPKDAPTSVSLIGEPITDPRQILLDRFCTAESESVVIRERGDVMHYMLAGDAVGRRSAVNMVMANYTAGCLSSDGSGALTKLRGPTMEITTPCKLAVLDVFMDEDVFRGVDPELRVYDTTVNGVADMNDEMRDCDRLELVERVERHGVGLSGMRIAEIPNYSDMVRHVIEARGLDASRMRLYRCRSRYPVYGAQFSFGFRPPSEG